jgi:hypothetical protein
MGYRPVSALTPMRTLQYDAEGAIGRLLWPHFRDQSKGGQLLIVFELNTIERFLADIGRSEVNLQGRQISVLHMQVPFAHLPELKSVGIDLFE